MALENAARSGRRSEARSGRQNRHELVPWNKVKQTVYKSRYRMLTLDGALTIGQLAERTGVQTGTLRMWEQRHGFPRAERLPSGHRRYAEAEVERVLEVVRARDAGLSLPRRGRALTRPEPAGPRTSIFAGLRRRPARAPAPTPCPSACSCRLARHRGRVLGARRAAPCSWAPSSASVLPRRPSRAGASSPRAPSSRWRWPTSTRRRAPDGRARRDADRARPPAGQRVGDHLRRAPGSRPASPAASAGTRPASACSRCSGRSSPRSCGRRPGSGWTSRARQWPELGERVPERLDAAGRDRQPHRGARHRRSRTGCWPTCRRPAVTRARPGRCPGRPAPAARGRAPSAMKRRACSRSSERPTASAAVTRPSSPGRRR